MSVQVSLTGLSFLVADSISKIAIFSSEKNFSTKRTPEELLFEIEKVISETKELQGDFEKVTIVYATDYYTLVPLQLFDETKASEYLKFNAKILGNDYIAHDLLKDFNVVIVYVPFVNINNYWFDRFGSFQYYHAASVLLKKILTTEQHTLLPKIFLHVQKEHFDCIVIKNGKLILCNSYPYRSKQDFIYYVLFCMEQLKLNPDTVNVKLLGMISDGDELYLILYTYIRNISFFEKEFSENKIAGSETEYSNFLIQNVL